MRIAVCDDCSLDRELICDMLKRYFADRSIELSIQTYLCGINLMYDIEEGTCFDIVFLDIFMDNVLGIDAAKRLREVGFSGEIVFLTSSERFAVDSYEVGASGYLLKPLDYDRLAGFMDKMTQGIEGSTLQVKFRNSVTRVPFNKILYIESSNAKCTVCLSDGNKYTVYKKLGDIEKELDDPRFLRCHQSYLVNMEHVRHMDTRFILDSGDAVLIRQHSLREIREQYLKFLKERGLM